MRSSTSVSGKSMSLNTLRVCFDEDEDEDEDEGVGAISSALKY